MDRERAQELLHRERERIEGALAAETPSPDTELSSEDQLLGDEACTLYDNELCEGRGDHVVE